MTPEIAMGARVLLRSCPHGQPGIVVKAEGRRVLVCWEDLDFTGRHKAANLIQVETSDTVRSFVPKAVAFGTAATSVTGIEGSGICEARCGNLSGTGAITQ